MSAIQKTAFQKILLVTLFALVISPDAYFCASTIFLVRIHPLVFLNLQNDTHMSCEIVVLNVGSCRASFSAFCKQPGLSSPRV